MRILLLGRHAATGDSENSSDLPLSDEGKKEAQAMARRIRSVVRNLPLTIWSSSAQRAKETTSIVKETIEDRCNIVEVKFFDELWSDTKHVYQEDWLNENVASFERDALLIIAHAEISEFAVSLGCKYIPLSTGDCMMIRGDWAMKI